MDRPSLTAKELYRRYRQGERSFVGVSLIRESLRGMRLHGIDLSGANLSYADLRGASFKDAKLVSADLCGAKTGTLKRWAVPKVLVASVVIATSSLFTAMFWTLYATLMFDPNGSLEATRTVGGDIAVGIVGLATMTGLLLSFYRRGTLGSLGIATAVIASGVVVAVMISLFYPGVSTNSNVPIVAHVITYTALLSALYSFCAVLFIFPSIVASTVAVAVSGTTAVIFTSASFFIFALVFVSIIAVLTLIIDGSAVFTNAVIAAIIFAVTGAGAILVVSYLISCRALRGDPREHLIFTVTLWIVGWGGTQFNGADLTNADCSKATLKSAHFDHSTNLTCTRFHLSQKVNLARPGKTILSDFAVQNLLITLRGRGKTYIGKNLKGANLAGADLVCADFTEADLSQATLEGVELQQANLTKTQVLGTEFRQANLTGACLEAWNIDSTTQLDGALCDYVYLLEPPQERRPSSGIFQPGEFTKLFEEVLHTIDLIFQNGIDWKAFVKAFDKVRVDNDGTELTIQSIEKKRDGAFVVRVDVPADVDKAVIEQSFWLKYRPLLAAKEEQILRYSQDIDRYRADLERQRQENTRLGGVIETMAKKQSREERHLHFYGSIQGSGYTEGNTYHQQDIGIGHQNGGTNQGNKIAGTLNESSPELLSLIQSLREHLALLDNPELRNEASEHLGDLATEIESGEPKPSRVKAALTMLWTIGKDVTLVANAVLAIAERLGIHLS